MKSKPILKQRNILKIRYLHHFIALFEKNDLLWAMQKEKWEELAARMLRLGLREEDLTEKFILGCGSGGSLSF